MMNISPVHGSVGFWISSSCSIPVFFVGPIPMSAGKTEKKTICFNWFVFLHDVSPSSERLCGKKSTDIYRFLWVSSCFQLFLFTSRGLSKVPLSSQATDHVGTNIRSLGVDATSQPRLRGNQMKSWPVDAGGPVIKHGKVEKCGKVERYMIKHD